MHCRFKQLSFILCLLLISMAINTKQTMPTIKSNSVEIANLQDTLTPFGVRLSGIYMRSFAYVTLKDRLPIILTKIIDNFSRNKEQIAEKFGQNATEEIKQMVGFISQLKNEIVTNKALKILPTIENDDDNDASVWNKYLEDKTEKEGTVPTWFNTEWLYCECYMYRSLVQKFLLMNALRTYDPFQQQKRDTFINSLNTIKILNKYLLDIIDRVKLMEEVEKKQKFFKLIQLNLWGNRCDLSLSAGSDSSQISNPIEQLETLHNYILDNATDFAWQLLSKQKLNDSNIIDMVLDNAGYELFTDICLAIFLVNFGLAGKVRFYVKRYPWYVSDTNTHDFHWVLDYMKKSSNPELERTAQLSYDYLKNNIWTIEEESYWTSPYDFAEMKEKDKVLYAKLSDAKLVIFKGDLNYRKLLGDINWEYTTSFMEALRGFRPTNILSLRTIKSDVCVGLPLGKGEMLYEKDENWMITGKYGLIQATVENVCNCSTIC
ncbi:damage-control phosphatase ARMT1-like isoform X1 [Vespa mandarinia]|uniref:damage-control phosphatase ARMT1-like isoform X1 n=3 Tax=Vespa mandarinia TaxID=7446 RepID=UPI00161E7DC5|nr:damage-control phosphatase ARMT1-like isoform X1 [Vespa mandarinia]